MAQAKGENLGHLNTTRFAQAKGENLGHCEHHLLGNTFEFYKIGAGQGEKFRSFKDNSLQKASNSI